MASVNTDAVEEFEFEADDDFQNEPARLPWSLSYVLICILLPTMAGSINGFAWSGWAIYVRSNNWDLALAGVGVSVGSLVRMMTQQVIFRAGIWTCAVFAALHATVAALAIIYTEEAPIIFCQAGAIVGFDVTVAIEGITFDLFAQSEAMVASAQSTVLATFTIAYACAATAGGVIYDLSGWKGMSVFHTCCTTGQFLVMVMQPALRESFKLFLYGPEIEELPEDEDGEEDGLEAATGIIPATAKPKTSGNSGGNSGKSSHSSGREAALPGAIEDVLLPGALEDPEVGDEGVQARESEGRAKKSMASKASRASKVSRTSKASRVSTASALSKASKASYGRSRLNPTIDNAFVAKRLLSRDQKRSTFFRGERMSGSSAGSSRSIYSRGTIRSGRSTQRSNRSDKSAESGVSKGSRGSKETHRTGSTNQTSGTVLTLMSKLSRFSLKQAGQNCQYNYGIMNGLRPHVASTAVNGDIATDSEDEREQEQLLLEEDGENTGKNTVVSAVSVGEGQPNLRGSHQTFETDGGTNPRSSQQTFQTIQTVSTQKTRSTRRSSQKRIGRDLYWIALLLVLSSFNNNTAYSVEWATFALFFKEQHGWTSATWAGICQTSGDLLAATMMGFMTSGERQNLDEIEGLRWVWHALTGQPYNLVIFALIWALLNAGLCVPVLPVAIASQVLMGTLYVFSVKAVTDMNLYYSAGETSFFLQLQVQCRNADAVGALISGYFTQALYQVNPLVPYLCCSALGAFTGVAVMIGFCQRLGFGDDIETAEAKRSRRLGLKRESTWKIVSSKSSVSTPRGSAGTVGT